MAASDQSQIEFELQISPDVKSAANSPLGLSASSKYDENDFTVSSNSVPLQIVQRPQRLEVYPKVVRLDGSHSRQQMIVTGYDTQQSPRDWTRDVRIISTDSMIAEVKEGVVYPKRDGECEILVEVGSLRQSIPLRVSNMQSKTAVAFESEVLVALSKQGCNSGACHGSPSGKGGFRLSLRAFDKQLDQLTLIREDFGRRVNTLDPEKSLLLIKPSMKVEHGGGKRLHKDDVAYAILRDWIAQGAREDPAGTACVCSYRFFRMKNVFSLFGLVVNNLPSPPTSPMVPSEM